MQQQQQISVGLQAVPRHATTELLVLVSVPEHILHRARRLMMKYHGYCAAFTREDPLNPTNLFHGSLPSSSFHQESHHSSITKLLVMSAKQVVKRALKKMVFWAG